MATKRGQLNCTENTRNVGFGSCFEDWKIIKGAFLFDNPRSFTDEEIADLQATLEDAAADDVKSQRMYPIHDFRAPTDNTEDPIVQQFDYGSKAIVRDGDVDWMFQYVDGGNCLNTSLRTHNGKRWALFYDKENKILGYKKSGQFAAIPLQFFYAYPWKLATGSTTAAYMVRFVLESKFVNELRDFVKAPFDPAEISGLEDIEVKVNSFDEGTGVANVTFQTACGASNLYDRYKAQFVAGLFTVLDDEGNEVTVETLVGDDNSKSFDMTMTAAELPDNGIITIKGPVPSAMVSGGIPGFEFVPQDIEIAGS